MLQKVLVLFLPDGAKTRFLIFDCWNVFDWFNIHPEGKELKPSEAIPSRIFILQLEQLRHFQNKNDRNNIAKVREKLLNNINRLPLHSVTIKEQYKNIELAMSPKLWERKGLDPIKFLKDKIAPLMRYQQNVNPQKLSFTITKIFYKREYYFSKVLQHIFSILIFPV